MRPTHFPKISRLLIAAILSLSWSLGWALDSSKQTRTVVFQQPSTVNLEDTFVIPKVVKRPPPTNKFSLLLWQPNPKTPDGTLIRYNWDTSSRAGIKALTPADQLSFGRSGGSSSVIVEGDAVGAYINSADLPPSTHKNKMMITPAYQIPTREAKTLLHMPGDRLEVTMDLQVPTANDQGNDKSNTYVNAGLLFDDSTSDTRISFGCNLFKRGGIRNRMNVGFDEDSQNIMVNGPLYSDNPIFKPLPGSALQSISPWKGWRNFTYSLSYESFQDALQRVRERYPDARMSMNPADWKFVKFHLNAELHFGSGPSELGWSMRHAQVVSITSDSNTPH